MDAKIKERFLDSFIPEPNSGCWLWLKGTFTTGYGQMRVHKRKSHAHRVSWEIHNGPIPDGLCVLHKCDTPSCVNPAHLFLGTLKDNTRDMIKKHRSCRGEKHWNSKLTETQIRDIKFQLLFGIKQRLIADKHNISEGTISRIKHGTTWRCIQ